MSIDVLANFTCLDELTQVIYQGVYRFVVLSTVSDQWSIYLGLSGKEGRWWQGGWTKADILQIVGAKTSDKLLEAFAEKLAETLVQGELYIGDWHPEEGANIKLTFGPSSKKPLHVVLVEISSTEAASHATDIFLDIALQAQSRKCRLHPDQFATPYISAPSLTVTASARVPGISDAPNRPIAPIPRHLPPPTHSKRNATSSGSQDTKAQDEIKALKAELEKQKQQSTSGPKARSSAPPKPLKGASLANPNKKARKYQAIEFESDDE